MASRTCPPPAAWPIPRTRRDPSTESSPGPCAGSRTRTGAPRMHPASSRPRLTRAARQSCVAYRRAKYTSTRERSPAGGSSLFSQHGQHQPQRRGIVRNTKPVAAGQQQLDSRTRFFCGLRLYQREADRRVLLPQPLPPSIETGLTQVLLATECAHRLAALFLLCNPLAPLLATFDLFAIHVSTMRRRHPHGQWCSCDAYADFPLPPLRSSPSP